MAAQSKMSEMLEDYPPLPASPVLAFQPLPASPVLEPCSEMLLDDFVLDDPPVPPMPSFE